MKNSYDTLTEAINDLTKMGYDVDFNLVNEGIESKDLKARWLACDLEVVKYYRFEGMTDPGDNTILYVIETKDCKKGLLVDNYSAKGTEISPEMIKKLKIHHD